MTIKDLIEMLEAVPKEDRERPLHVHVSSGNLSGAMEVRGIDRECHRGEQDGPVWLDVRDREKP